MSRTRQWTAVGIVGVLALALGLLWRSQNTAAPTTTTSSTSTTAVAAVTTTNPVPTTLSPTTTSAEQRVVEVEAILTDLWIGWLDAIYRKDADALWQVVATTSQHDSGLEAMETMSFISVPTKDGLSVTVDEVLLDRSDCLVSFQIVEASDVQGSPVVDSVEVLWADPRYGWRFATSWQYAEDLWQADCDEIVREETP